MKTISIKAVFSIVLLLLINQTVFADNRFGQSKGFKKPQRSASHPVHKPKPSYKTRKKPYYKPSFHPPGHRHDYYRLGYNTRYLPYGHRRVFFGNMEYFFFDGYFYRQFRNEYRIVDAPIGAIVLSLPRLHFTLQWNGLDFFLAGSTYYRHHPGGYIVVRNPGFSVRW